MRTISMLVAGIFLFAAGLTAQDSDLIIVVQTSGQVEFLSDQETQPSRVLPGQQIPGHGFIRFDDKAWAKLLYQGQTRQLEEAGTYDLATLFRKDTQTKGLGFMNRFWQFVTEGVSSADNSAQLEKYHQRYMDKAGGVKGYAEAGYGIAASSLTRAILAEPKVDFQWEPAAVQEDDASLYQFVIYRKVDDKLVFQALTTKNALSIDLSQFHVVPGDDYYWQVIRESGTGQKEPAQRINQSAKVSFTFQPDALGAGLERLKADEDYRQADAVEKGLMEAATLEWEGLIYSADGIYRDLLALDGDNALVRKLYAAFLARNASLEESQDALAGLPALRND